MNGNVMNDIGDEDDALKRRGITKFRVNPYYDIYKRRLTRLKLKLPVFETIDGEIRKGNYNDVKDKRVLGRIDVDDPAFFERWRRLSSTAMTLIMFILHKMPNGEDKVQINSTEFKIKTGIDLSSFYKARNLLVAEGWIQYYELPKTYWVNYARLCKGNTVGPYHTEEKHRIRESIFGKEIIR